MTAWTTEGWSLYVVRVTQAIIVRTRPFYDLLCRCTVTSGSRCISSLTTDELLHRCSYVEICTARIGGILTRVCIASVIGCYLGIYSYISSIK
jgi:hypothetical protein